MITKKILHALAFTPISGGRWGLPCLFWGPPGIGKTAIIEDFGRETSLPVETLSPGERGEGAFGVTPVPDGKHLSYPAPDWTERMTDGGVVFVDEITLAEPALQKYIMALIHARRIGSAQLGPRVRVIAAANAADSAAGGWDLALPLANRMLHLDWDAPTAEDWSDWLLGGADSNPLPPISARTEESRVDGEWPLAFAKASGVVSGFVRRRPDLLHKMPAAGDPNSSRAWPSHRSWEMAARVTATGDVHHLSSTDRETLLKGAVGGAAASEMIEFLEKLDLPDPTNVLDGVIPFEHNPKRLDRTAAILSSCAALAAWPQNGNRLRHAAKLWSMMSTTMNGAEDVAIPAARVLCRAGFIMLQEAQPMLSRIGPFLEAAGIKRDKPAMHGK